MTAITKSHFFHDLGLGEVIDEEKTPSGLWQMWSSLILTKFGAKDVYNIDDIMSDMDIIRRLTKGKKVAHLGMGIN